jgi:pre-60S factor REI1
METVVSNTTTCMACSFVCLSAEEYRSHYKSDWHRFNLKRKVANLGPVTLDQFEKRRQAALVTAGPAEKAKFSGGCVVCKKLFSNENALKNHEASKKHLDNLKAAEKVASAAAKSLPQSSSPTAVSSSSTPSESTPIKVGSNDVDDDDIVVKSDGVEVEMEVGEGEDISEEAARKVLDSSRRLKDSECVFCNKDSGDFDGNVQHILNDHGFYIPDVDCLVDLRGFIRHIQDKVALGKMCLWCNGHHKQFDSLYAVQNHMTDKGHCKILYEEGEDLHEYAPFYDYSKDEDEDDTVLEVDALGELHLPNGKVVGNRAFKQVYKQYLKAEEERPEVLANQKMIQDRIINNQLAYFNGRGLNGGTVTAMDLIEYKKEVKKANKIQYFQERRKQYLSVHVGRKANKLQTHFKHRDPLV